MGGLMGAGMLLVQTVAAPVCLALVIARLLAVQREDRCAFVLYGLGLWSGLTAVALDLALRFAPGLPRSWYVTGYALLVIGILAAAMRPARGLGTPAGAVRQLADLGSDWRRAWRELHVFERLLLAVVAGLGVILVLQNLAQPLTGNDAIVHTIVARTLARDLSTALYPFAAPDPTTGFLLEGVHPLGFPASKALFMIVLGDLDTPWHKPLTAAYFVMTLVLVGILGVRLLGRTAAVYAVATTAFTPLLLHSVMTAHIDPLRMYAFFACFVFLIEFARSGRTYWLVGGALALIVCLHVHAGNLIAFGFLGPLFLMVARGGLLVRLGRGVAVVTPAVVLASPQFVANWRDYGAVLGVDYALERHMPAPFAVWTGLQRGIETLGGILANGALAPFFDLTWFAVSFWLGLMGLVLLVRQGRWREPPFIVLLGAIAIYAALMTFAVATGRHAFYFNTRYMLIMLPFAALLAGHLTAQLLAVDWGKLMRRDESAVSTGLGPFALARMARELAGAATIAGLSVASIASATLVAIPLVLALAPPVSRALFITQYLIWRTLRNAFLGGPRAIAVVAAAAIVIALAAWVTRTRNASVSELRVRILASLRSGAMASFEWIDGWRRRQSITLANATVFGYITVPFLLAVGFYVTSSGRQLMQPPYLAPSLVLASDVEKAKATVTNRSGVGWLDTALAVRDLADRDQSLRVLTLRDSELYYYGGGLRFSTYDKRIWPLFDTSTAEAAKRFLLGLGVRYIYMPNYSIPVANGSGLGKLMLDPRHVSVAQQSNGAVFTLLELLERPAAPVSQVLYQHQLSPPLALSSARFDYEPRALGDCQSMSNVRSGVAHWYATQLLAVWLRSSCLDLFKDQNWIGLEPGSTIDRYRLTVQLASAGCAYLRLLHRIPLNDVQGNFDIVTQDFTHYALAPGEEAGMWFTQPAGADAFAVGFVGLCGRPASVESFKVERWRARDQ